MNEIKDFSNSVMNQVRYNAEEFKDNVFKFEKKPAVINPFNSMQFQWQLAQLRKAYVFWATLPMQWNETFLTVWSEVYSPEGRKEQHDF